MTKCKPKFIKFSVARMKSQGDEIRQWAQSDNPLLSKVCKEIIEAAGQAQGGRKP